MKRKLPLANNAPLVLISFPLCPYVQRAVIAAEEAGIDVQRVNIDLANKPEWFSAISPTEKVPVMVVDGEQVLFESAAICEFINEIAVTNLHPSEPVSRAKHRGWMDFASGMLANIAVLYSTQAQDVYTNTLVTLRLKLEQLESEVNQDGHFAGSRFHLIDAIYASVFRYFEVLGQAGQCSDIMQLLAGLPKVTAWQKALLLRPSVQNAVTTDYPAQLLTFVARKNGVLSGKLACTQESDLVPTS
ncbi:glutathione S-transferase family protein [Motilimonas eburnea]|uniref:glutathione S-transferase family protein n=1 Tax=Motilimonas eburnea TaxID=1737488 RepID=UPI001E5956AC|nr:glutathione S-transferase family protein [Motilimonas eburnea]MCE2573264.1 glutathione S-transferase family protein [Motilimonas eburnea]